MGKKQRVKRLSFNIYDRRVVQVAVNSLLQSERNTGHDPKLMMKRMKILELIDDDEVEEHFAQIVEAGARGEKITREDRHGDGEQEYVFRQGQYYWIKERMEKANFFGMLPNELMESLAKWGIEFSDEDLWGNDEVEDVEEVEEESAEEEDEPETELEQEGQEEKSVKAE